VIGIPLAAGMLGLLFGVALPRIRRARQRHQGITIATFADPGIAVPPRPARLRTPEYTSPTPPSEVARPVAEPARSPYAPPAQEATGTMGADWGKASAAATVEPPPARLRLEVSGERSAFPHAEPKPPLKVRRPQDGTLQFLPGRLEILEGRDLGQEIRFVRLPGPAPTEVTFGRQDGVPYRHVQLHEPTVSRLHAKVTREDSAWRLTSLSHTNPVSVNGALMSSERESVLLHEGDRIEMGEVVFRFHAK